MNELDIQLLINPTCELVAIDKTSYQNLHYNDYGGELQYLRDRSKHVSIEFLTDVDGLVMRDTINLEKGLRSRSELLDGNTSVFHFPKDGTFTYYKFLVPYLFHMCKDDVFNVYHQTFYHDGKFYYSEFVDTLDIREDIGGIDAAIHEILRNSNEIDISELWKYQGTQTFSFQKNIFSVCKLQKCLVNLQREILNNPNSCMECGMESSLRFKRDFLLSALYVFDYLKDTNNYDEAQRILDNMNSCGSYLCGDGTNDKSDCGCGRVVY